MADESDPKVSRGYRELGAEEPPRALDQAILAAARRAADEDARRSHAPLVTPAGRHRWYFGLAAAAILLLAVGVTVHIERQQPDPEALSSLPESRKEEEKPTVVPSQPPVFAPDPQPSSPAARAESAGPAADAARAPAAEPPERWLERIAQLRKDARHEEADKALAEFRKRYPEYRMTDALRQHVEGK